MASQTPDQRHPIFGTLGPSQSNHALILSHYLVRRGLADGQQCLFGDFSAAFAALLDGSVDYVLQVSAHASHSEWVSRTMGRAFIVDTFIARSRPLAILSRTEVTVPGSIGLQPATRHYTDLSPWPTQVEEPTIVAVAEGLLAGRYDSGIAALDVAARYPDRLRVDRELGAALDAWVLFGREPLTEDFVLDPEAPAVRLFAGVRSGK
ncbi:hypothetical protein [Mesorhizobium sp. CAU 1741]|uniref:hypothetical protein n=1 Tax=Mesorhizobium sp. CAU 1741 TaxID=3140366 RepID=UPI00325BADE0